MNITKNMKNNFVLLFSFTILLFLISNAYGNEPKLSSSEETTPIENNEATNIDDTNSQPLEDHESESHFAEAGKFEIGEDPTIWILLFLLIVALGIGLERCIYLLRNKGNNAVLLDTIIEGLSKDSKGRAIAPIIKNIQANTRNSIESRIAIKALEGWRYGVKAMTEFSEAGMESERRKLSKGLVILSTLGNNTPFIGLLGTVLGIMKAFRSLALEGDAGPAVVMEGISEALVATAFGLGVAIPCVILFNIFNKLVKNKLSNANEIINIIFGIRTAFETKGQEGVQRYAVDSHLVEESSIDDVD